MRSALIAALLGAASAAAAGAQPAPAPQPPSDAPPPVEVSLGPAVAARTHELGAESLDAERQVLAKDVQEALVKRGVRRVRLVIADIQPNKPTPAQLGHSPGLRASSIGIGGAAITGEVTMDDGVRYPLRYRYFDVAIDEVTDLGRWSGAETAFAGVATNLRRGKVPYDRSSWPPAHHSEQSTGSLIPG